MVEFCERIATKDELKNVSIKGLKISEKNPNGINKSSNRHRISHF